MPQIAGKGFFLPYVSERIASDMAATICDYLRPRTLREALALLGSGDKRTLVIGGGVSVVLSGPAHPVRAIDLQGLGLDTITLKGNRLRIGAMTTLHALETSAEAAKVAGGVVCKACRTAASLPLRNLISVGGNIVQCYYWSTLPPLLLGLDAVVCLQSAEGRRTMPAAEFFSTHPRKHLAPGELVVGVELPLVPASRGRGGKAGSVSHGASFLKYAKTSMDYAQVHAFAWLEVEDRVVRQARVAVGALDTLPARCPEAEALVTGKPLDEKLAREAGRAGVAHRAIRADIRVSREYRRRVAAVYLASALEAAWHKANPRRAGLHF
jgi:carbon-monoxide dehydrogenase medium subunit